MLNRVLIIGGSLRYAGATYLGSALEVADGPALSGAVIPGCNDVVTRDEQGNDTSPKEPDEPVEAHRIPRVPTRLALAYNGRAYLAIGYLPQLAGHPLHRAWARGRSVTPSCGRAWHLRATVAITPTPGPVPVRTSHGRFALLDFEVAGVSKDLVTRRSSRRRGANARKRRNRSMAAWFPSRALKIACFGRIPSTKK